MSIKDWQTPKVRWYDVDRIVRQRKKYDYPIMFPGTHDISYENFDACVDVLGALLDAGNKVLLVSKPVHSIIKAICLLFPEHKDKINFRFTIGSTDDSLLKHWEPGAPGFEERLESLKTAYELGHVTSVSVEPMLDIDNSEELLRVLSPYSTQAIWFGLMNHLYHFDTDLDQAKTEAGIRRVKRNRQFFGAKMARKVRKEGDRIRVQQTPNRILQMYNELKDHPSARFKSSIRRLIGVEELSHSELW